MLKGFPRQRVAGVPKGLSSGVSPEVYTPRPVVATAADLKELAFASYAALKDTAPHNEGSHRRGRRGLLLIN